MPIKPGPAPKGTLIGLLRSWKPYEGDFDVKDIGPYRRLCAYFIGISFMPISVANVMATTPSDDHDDAREAKRTHRLEKR